jgi:hypothetical protein
MSTSLDHLKAAGTVSFIIPFVETLQLLDDGAYGSDWSSGVVATRLHLVNGEVEDIYFGTVVLIIIF